MVGPSRCPLFGGERLTGAHPGCRPSGDNPLLEVSEEPFRVLSAGGQLTLGSLGVLSDMWGAERKEGKKGGK